MAIHNFAVSTFSRDVYIFGNRKLTSFAQEYWEPIKKYAATGIVNDVHYPISFNGYSDSQILNALNNGWITQEEYDETMAYRVIEQ